MRYVASHTFMIMTSNHFVERDRTACARLTCVRYSISLKQSVRKFFYNINRIFKHEKLEKIFPISFMKS